MSWTSLIRMERREGGKKEGKEKRKKKSKRKRCTLFPLTIFIFTNLVFTNLLTNELDWMKKSINPLSEKYNNSLWDGTWLNPKL